MKSWTRTLLSFSFVALTTSTVFAGTPSFKKVMIVVLENTNYDAAMKQPFLTELAKRGASLDNMTALTHPSQGNYVSMVAGDTFGIKDDKKIDLNDKNIADLLEAKGLTWKVYAENYPGNCFLGDSGDYVRKHVPFISFQSISSNPARCKNIVNADQLDRDIKANALANYSLYVPNMKNDGHNTGIAFADKFMASRFGSLIQNHQFMDQMLLVVTFDESGSNKNNQIYTVVLGDSVIAGARSNKAYTHYSILKTIEEAFALGTLNKNDAAASAISDVIK